jgi:hypothetical protein
MHGQNHIKLRSGLNPTAEFPWKIYDQRDGKNKL